MIKGKKTNEVLSRMPHPKSDRNIEYQRDSRSPTPYSEDISKSMSANKGKNTGPEIALRKALWKAGLRGYRVNVKSLPGRPDIVFTRKNLAIFVHGCFWHRCPICMTRIPKTHEEFWIAKFEKNKVRDKKALESLCVQGWKTQVIWECEIRDDLNRVVNNIKQCVGDDMSDVDYDSSNSESIIEFAHRLKGHTLKELTSEKGSFGLETVSKSKGGFGTALEELYFHIHPGNNPGVPDFKEAGLELKSCPTIKKGEKLVAKERLVLNIINYSKLADEEWITSTFFKKNGRMLLIFYQHEAGIAGIDLRIVLTGGWTFPIEDLLIIRSDWERIKAKVMEGKAHELSEGDTLYLRACTKDAVSRASKVQPMSEKKAKQRAFSLKPSYVNSIIERLQQLDLIEDLKNAVVKNPEELRKRTFEQLVEQKFLPFLEKSINEIAKELKISYQHNVKNYNALVTKKILGVKDEILEFRRADIINRSILLDYKGGLKESISFPAFDYAELAAEMDWESSTIKELFERRFFFVIYQMRPNGIKELRRVMFWSMPYEDLLKVKDVWKVTTERIRQRKYEDLPKISENNVAHIRPHGRNAQDRVMAPDGSMVKKQSFWLNAKYIAEQVSADTRSDLLQSKLLITGKDSVTIR